MFVIHVNQLPVIHLSIQPVIHPSAKLINQSAILPSIHSFSQPTSYPSIQPASTHTPSPSRPYSMRMNHHEAHHRGNGHIHRTAASPQDGGTHTTALLLIRGHCSMRHHLREWMKELGECLSLFLYHLLFGYLIFSSILFITV